MPKGTLHNSKTGEEIKVGQTVPDFRGDSHIVKGWFIPGEVARNARVETDQGLFYTGVIDAEIHHKGEVYKS